jgi:hybrid cluster-associated redox disulfide protein
MEQPSLDDPDLPLSRLFERWPATAQALLERRMLCFGCPIAPFHTVTDACEEYRLDEEAFRARLRALASGPP